MPSKSEEEFFQKFNAMVNDAIKVLNIAEFDYHKWNTFYEFLVSSVGITDSTTHYYEFAVALTQANVVFKTQDEEKDYNTKNNLLKNVIQQATRLASLENKDINSQLYYTISSDTAMNTIAETIKNKFKSMETTDNDKIIDEPKGPRKS